MVPDMKKDYESYEYITVKIKYDLAAMCRESYEAFGWEVLLERISGEGRLLQLRRKRKLKNRAKVMEQQRKMEDALVALERLESHSELFPTMISILLGMVGAGCIAASILALQNDRLILFFLLEVPGIVFATLPIWMKRWLLKPFRKRYEKEMDAQRRLIREACRKGEEWL